MAGIVHKIGETLNMGGQKEGQKSQDQNKPGYQGDCKAEQVKPDRRGECKEQVRPGQPGECKEQVRPGHPGEQKEGCIDKIKDKFTGGAGNEKGEKKKKEKKKHEDGHESSDSD